MHCIAPASICFAGQAVRTMAELPSLVIVVLTHVCETLHLFPVGWDLRKSPGHYLDLRAAILGLVLSPAGYLLAFATDDPWLKEKWAMRPRHAKRSP